MMRWGEKSYHSLDYDLKQAYGEKVYKITLDGGMTCPNRDGHLGHGGCIFCSSEGSGDFAGSARACSVTEQIAAGKADPEWQTSGALLYCILSGIYEHLCAGGNRRRAVHGSHC